MQEVVINVREFPIFHSEYIKNVLDYNLLDKKEKKLYHRVQDALFQLTDIDVPFEFVEFYIDQKKFSPALMSSISFQQLLKNIESNQIHMLISSDKLDYLDNSKSVRMPANNEIIDRLQRVYELSHSKPYPEFYYHQIPITDDELFDFSLGFKKIKDEYLPFLNLLDLSRLSFSNVDFRNINFSNTNIENVDFNTVYQHSIAGSNFFNVNLFGKELENIDATDANLCGTYLTINSDNTILKDTKLDDTILLLADNMVISNPELQGYHLIKKKRNTKIHF